MIATRVVLRGSKATLDELAAFVAEARHRGVAGDATIRWGAGRGVFYVDVPVDVPAVSADEPKGCTSSSALVGTTRRVPCDLEANHDGPHIARVDDQKYGWTDADTQNGGRP
ncbi:hypothetical protein PBI_WALRUS_47 [Gordonia phage Walrus]|uniref:Uncharacterized protein n=1 Tax=Gordonia phage Walrus TaxID=2517927 RepID=A0A481S1P9_9CAUD|nr:hypothetical protein KNU50_gp47 [Gordonia phage Walrus]QBG78438.1 hypothetical protein PBI_WALRUS_47 [Gordonia phage Walrus]